jgi:deazaflavin-dependent oxidoreductase (nitroreductase family)
MTRIASSLVGVLAVASAVVHAEDSLAEAEVAQKLAAVADVGTVRLTTFGRKTGKPHTVPIWFASQGATIYIWTLNMQRDWPRNIAANPQIELEIGGLKVTGVAKRVSDPEAIDRVAQLRDDKYFFARVGGWFGMTIDGTFAVTVQSID